MNSPRNWALQHCNWISLSATNRRRNEQPEKPGIATRIVFSFGTVVLVEMNSPEGHKKNV